VSSAHRLIPIALTDWKRKWREQLAHALDRAAWESRIQRWHRETFKETLSPFDLERLASVYQQKGDISRQRVCAGGCTPRVAKPAAKVRALVHRREHATTALERI
jgi:hypothetical protein